MSVFALYWKDGPVVWDDDGRALCYSTRQEAEAVWERHVKNVMVVEIPEDDAVFELFRDWYELVAHRCTAAEIIEFNLEAETRAKALGIAPERLYGLLVPF